MTPEMILTNSAGITSIVALWLYAISGAWKKYGKASDIAALAVLTLSFICVSGSLVLRGLEAQRFPVSNMYESLLLFAWGLLAAYLGLHFVFRLGRLGGLGALAALSVSSVFLYASWLPASQKSIQPLMPALVSYWRAIHVPPLIVSYALLVLAGLTALAHLCMIDRRKTAASCILALLVSLACIWMGTTGKASQLLVQLCFWAGSALTVSLIFIFLKQEWKSPIKESDSIDKIDEISQRCIAMAFPLLTFGIITGAFWANHAWGAYWSWDPKESMSLVTWLFYATYLHLRSKYSDRADLMSAIAVIGLLATLLTYLGFNFLGFGGLHSYGQIE